MQPLNIGATEISWRASAEETLRLLIGFSVLKISSLAGREFERCDAGSPVIVGTARTGNIFRGIPERAVVTGVDGQAGVIAPTESGGLGTERNTGMRQHVKLAFHSS